MSPINDKLKKRVISDNNEQKTNSESNRHKQIVTSHDELRRATSSSTHRLWTRTVIIFALMALVYFYGLNRRNKEINFAPVRENIAIRMQKFICDSNYELEIGDEQTNCAPKKCGRFVTDKLVERDEAELLHQLAQRVITKAGSDSSISILDIHSGILTHDGRLLNVFAVKDLHAEFRTEHIRTYNLIKGKIKLAIAEQFGISSKNIYLTNPTFFSRLINTTAKDPYDKYWHQHVTKARHPAFHYTSILYLNSLGNDFHGGRFVFVDGVDKNRSESIIEPKLGRVLAFTSGAENKHYVEKIIDGERFAITMSFTCNKKFGIDDLQMPLRNLET